MSDNASASESERRRAPESAGEHVLQKVVFPLDRDPDILPLYADPEVWTSVSGRPVRLSERARLGNILGRESARILAGRRVSFGTYFNAFPASYWQHWTTVSAVQLTVRTNGRATIVVYRSNGAGIRQRVSSFEVDGIATTTTELPLDRYADGGWIWFDIVADAQDLIFEGARWSTRDEPARRGRASIGITTYNKPQYCVETLLRVAQDPDVRDVIDRVFVVDQGERHVADEPRFADARAALGDSLEIITQSNLGGSGGFARAMVAALARRDSDFIQLLDDDVQVEPESIRRSVVFGRYSSEPTIVGGHMFDLLNRPTIHAWAEVVDDRPFVWRVVNQEQMPHDFSQQNLRQSPFLHARLDADYNGWWMSLIPLDVVRRIGLPIPAFIKWDDAEYSLRAREHGVGTVSVPGVALWHVSWLDKDDSLDWQAYFHARNRILTALLHSRSERGGTLLRYSRRADLKHLLAMQYYPVVLRHRAIRDLLSGPSHLGPSLRNAMPRARALAARFPETTVHRQGPGGWAAREGRRTFTWSNQRPGWRQLGAMARAAGSALAVNWFRPASPQPDAEPDVEFARRDALWWRVAGYDSALVSTADGSGKNLYRRDRRMFRHLLRESIALHRVLARRWPALSAEYRRSAAGFTSQEAWRRQFTEET